MKNEHQSLTLEIPRELFHALLKTLVQVRIKGKPETTNADRVECIEIGHGIKVLEKKDSQHS